MHPTSALCKGKVNYILKPIPHTYYRGVRFAFRHLFFLTIKHDFETSSHNAVNNRTHLVTCNRTINSFSGNTQAEQHRPQCPGM